MSCLACGDTKLDTRGFPCHICQKRGNAYVLRPVRREPTLEEQVAQLRRLEQALLDPTHGMETPEQEVERLRRELSSLEKGEEA